MTLQLVDLWRLSDAQDLFNDSMVLAEKGALDKQLHTVLHMYHGAHPLESVSYGL